jgi:hypothetical protein
MNFDRREAVMHDIVPFKRFPGSDYYEVLGWLHEALRPESYLDICVFEGRSLNLAMPPTIAVGIDPFPEVDNCWRTRTVVLAMSSSEFFAKHKHREFFGADLFRRPWSTACTIFEQAIDDIFNWKYMRSPNR